MVACYYHRWKYPGCHLTRVRHPCGVTIFSDRALTLRPVTPMQELRSRAGRAPAPAAPATGISGTGASAAGACARRRPPYASRAGAASP